MVDGLERSDAQRIAALEARVAELERGNPTCVCGAGAPKPRRDDGVYPLPWIRGATYNGWTNIYDNERMMVCQAATPMAADRILSIASRLEAAEKVVGAANNLVDCLRGNTHMLHDPSVVCGSCDAVRRALSAYDKSLAGEGGG